MNALFLIPTFQIAALLIFTKIVSNLAAKGQIKFPFSMSNSWYALAPVKKRYYFEIFLMCITGSLIATVAYIPMQTTTMIMFIAGFVFVYGINIYAPFRSGNTENFFHNFFSVGAFSLILVGFWIGEGNWQPLGFYLAVIFPKMIESKMPSRTWWNESDGIACMIVGVIQLILNA